MEQIGAGGVRDGRGRDRNRCRGEHPDDLGAHRPRREAHRGQGHHGAAREDPRARRRPPRHLPGARHGRPRRAHGDGTDDRLLPARSRLRACRGDRPAARSSARRSRRPRFAAVTGSRSCASSPRTVRSPTQPRTRSSTKATSWSSLARRSTPRRSPLPVEAAWYSVAPRAARRAALKATQSIPGLPSAASTLRMWTGRRCSPRDRRGYRRRCAHFIGAGSIVLGNALSLASRARARPDPRHHGHGARPHLRRPLQPRGHARLSRHEADRAEDGGRLLGEPVRRRGDRSTAAARGLRRRVRRSDQSRWRPPSAAEPASARASCWRSSHLLPRARRLRDGRRSARSFKIVGGFAIGLTIAADILVGGPLTGAAMNPARAFGPHSSAAHGQTPGSTGSARSSAAPLPRAFTRCSTSTGRSR